MILDEIIQLLHISMNGALGHDSALQGYTGPGTTWADEMNFVMNHALVQDRSLDLLISSPARYQIYHGCPQRMPSSNLNFCLSRKDVQLIQNK